MAAVLAPVLSLRTRLLERAIEKVWAQRLADLEAEESRPRLYLVEAADGS